MPWFKVDDTLALHPKVIEAGNAAMGLWLRAGSYCAQQLTDGYVSQRALTTLGTRSQAAALVSAGLWDAAPGGWRFHDWDVYQPTREDVQRERAASKERQARWRESRKRNGVSNASRNATSNGVSHTVSHAVTNAAHGDGAPTRPDPTYTPKSPTSPTVTPNPDRPSADADEAFNTFWKHYPRKVGQGAARAAWRTATTEATPTTILAGLKATLPQLQQSDPQFIPHPATWLRDERWTDSPEDDTDPWAHLPRIGPA